MTLLTKTRTLNRLLQRAAGKPLIFREMAEVLTSTIQTSVFVVSRKGKVLGCAAVNPHDHDSLRSMSAEELRFRRKAMSNFLK